MGVSGLKKLVSGGSIVRGKKLVGFGGIRSHHDTSLVQKPDEIASRYKFVKIRRIKIINFDS